ncbi:hypothetical protein [Burkholderia ubonensis]|uniref:hypothetical protein n=1 Tax=Burkholderia ubonensis TaxID=101571 RepID=UPI000759722B|nr:hypothetical protein [Burkholderia ubonensis]KVC83990.1 hypothetical protein WI75_04790 [Burkholderia ubonensis]
MRELKFTSGSWERIGHRQIGVRVDGQLQVICEVWSGAGIEQANANEALIESAPDMALALQIALESIPAIQSSVRIVMETALVKAGVMSVEPRFASTSCSQCGKD